MKLDYPILEYDDTRSAIIEPFKIFKPLDGMPERCVLPIYSKVIHKLMANDLLTHITDIDTSMGAIPIYSISHEGTQIAVAHPGLCAPFVAIMLEVMIALGCRKFIACGSAGVLDKTLAKGTVVIPNSAIRDEGTSFHYLPPGREISVDLEIVKILESVLSSHGVLYKVGKTWTTDAYFRETLDRIAKRKSEGCLTVEMECSSFLAVAAFRDVRFGQLLATGDDVSGCEWDPRRSDKHQSFPESLFWWSVEACMKL